MTVRAWCGAAAGLYQGVILLGLACGACGDNSASGGNGLRKRDNTCSKESDCLRGNCDVEHHVCGTSETNITGLLFDVLPPAFGTDLVAGDTLVEVSNVRESASLSEVIKVAPFSRMNGLVSLSAGDSSCRPSPVRINLSPVSRMLGINAQRHTSGTRLDTRISAHQYVDNLMFTLGGVVDGKYDIYMQDAQEIDNSARPACQVAPWVVRARDITPSDGKILLLEQSSARPLTVTVPFVEGFLGWRVDVVHPLTGEQLSSEVEFKPANILENASGKYWVAALRLTEVKGGDWAEVGSELLRLRPPAAVSRPAIYLALSGLELQQPGQAVLPLVDPFGATVRYRAWVWQEGDPNKPVTGTVTFNALRISDLSEFRTELRRSVVIGESGQVAVELPPGMYGVQVTPSTLSGGSRFETKVVIWPPADGAVEVPEQAGAVLSVPRAATVRGQIRFEGEDPPDGTLVRLVADEERVLDRRPGQLPFVARDAEALVDGSGDFVVEGVDCRTCSKQGEGAQYTLLVVPPLASGVPWLVRTHLTIRSDMEFKEPATLRVPRLHTTQVTLGGSKSRNRRTPRIQALAFALIDKSGVLLADPKTVPCSRLAPAVAAVSRCAARAIPIAESVAGADGNLLFLLPQQVLPFSNSEFAVQAEADTDP